MSGNFFDFGCHTTSVTTIHLCCYNKPAMDHKLVPFCCCDKKKIITQATYGRVSFCLWIQKQSFCRGGMGTDSTGSWVFTSQLHITGRESKLGNKAMNMASNQWCSSPNRDVNTFRNSSMNLGPSTQIPDLMREFLTQTAIDPHTNK